VTTDLDAEVPFSCPLEIANMEILYRVFDTKLDNWADLSETVKLDSLSLGSQLTSYP